MATDYSKWERIACELDKEPVITPAIPLVDDKKQYLSRKECELSIVQDEMQQEQYQELSQVLDTLPNTLQHETMIPLGKKAFCPGKLTRTNEILVHLGQDHYVWRTASQAKEICQRQTQEISSRIQQSNDRLNALDQKYKQVETIAKMQDDFVDIREEEEKEQKTGGIIELQDQDIQQYFEIEEEERLKTQEAQANIDSESILDRLEQLEVTERGSTAEKLKRDGNTAFAAKKYEKAMESYTQALQVEAPVDKAVLYCNRSACLYRLKRYRESLEDAASAVKCNDKYAKAFYRKAMAHQQLEQYDSAAVSFEEASKLCPKDESLVKQAEEMRSKATPKPFASTILERASDETNTLSETIVEPERKMSRFKARRLAGYKS